MSMGFEWDVGHTRRLPRIPGAPPLKRLDGNEIFFVVKIRERRDFGAYQNSVTTRQLQEMIGTDVADHPPHDPLPGKTWWDVNDGQLYVWTGTEWVAASCPDCRDDDSDGGGVLVSASPPATCIPGRLWWSTGDGELYVWTGSEWVAASCCDDAPVALGDSPPASCRSGSLWWTEGALYVFTGAEWVPASCCEAEPAALTQVTVPSNANAAAAGVPVGGLYNNGADPAQVFVRTA